MVNLTPSDSSAFSGGRRHDLPERIPNNVDLSSNKRLHRLERWLKIIQWWRDIGPRELQDYHQVYVHGDQRGSRGWAHFIT